MSRYRFALFALGVICLPLFCESSHHVIRAIWHHRHKIKKGAAVVAAGAGLAAGSQAKKHWFPFPIWIPIPFLWEHGHHHSQIVHHVPYHIPHKHKHFHKQLGKLGIGFDYHEHKGKGLGGLGGLLGFAASDPVLNNELSPEDASNQVAASASGSNPVVNQNGLPNLNVAALNAALSSMNANQGNQNLGSAISLIGSNIPNNVGSNLQNPSLPNIGPGLPNLANLNSLLSNQQSASSSEPVGAVLPPNADLLTSLLNPSSNLL